MSINANTVILLKYNSMESALKLYVMVDIRMLWAAYELYKAFARSCTMAAVLSCMKAAFDCISIA